MAISGLRVTLATGSSTIAATLDPSLDFWLESITLHLDSTPTTSENFTITLNANDGSAYDAVLYSVDLSAYSAADLLWMPESGPLICEAGDAIDVAFPNTDGATYGLRIVARMA